MSASVAENKLNSSGWLRIVEIKSQVLKIDLKNQQKHEFEFSRAWDLFIGAIDDQDHRIRTSNEAFFQQNPQLLVMGIWGTFGQSISTHFGTVSPLSMFFFNQSLFLQNTEPLYPNSNIYLGSVFEFKFEFGLHRIRDLAIVCP